MSREDWTWTSLLSRKHDLQILVSWRRTTTPSSGGLRAGSDKPREHGVGFAARNILVKMVEPGSGGSERFLFFFFFFFSFFFFFFFAFPSYISGVHHFWVRFLRIWPFFFNPTIKVVTFRLRGWCVLGVFFVAGIHPSRTWTSGSFESVRWNACVHRLDLGLYSHPKEFLGEWSLNPC